MPSETEIIYVRVTSSLTGLPGFVVLIAASVAHDGYGADSRYE